MYPVSSSHRHRHPLHLRLLVALVDGLEVVACSQSVVFPNAPPHDLVISRAHTFLPTPLKATASEAYHLSLVPAVDNHRL